MFSQSREAAARSPSAFSSLPLVGWGCCCPTDLEHRGKEQNPRESTCWLRQERRTGAADGPCVQGSPSASRCGTVCEDAAFSSLPSPGHGRPSTGQTHLPSPWHHCRPSSCSTPELFKVLETAQPKHSICFGFLFCLLLPPQPSSPAQHLEKYPGVLPTEPLPSIPISKGWLKRLAMYFCAGGSAGKGTS